MSLSRNVTLANVTIPSGEALSEAIDFSAYSGGFIFVPSAWTAADIGFQINYVRGGTFINALNKVGALIEITGTAVSKAFQIPEELFGASYIKLWSQTAGTGQNQGADRAVVLVLKS